jgi:hypothetical protein
MGRPVGKWLLGLVRTVCVNVYGLGASHLVATGRVADMHRFGEVQMLDDRGRVGGVVVHVVAIRNLARASVASAVDPDDAVTVLDEEKHLRVPVVGTQRPAVMEDDGLAMASILIEDLDAIHRRAGALALAASV